MPLRKFDDQDFDRFIRDKFESAPQPTFDSNAWAGFMEKKRSPFTNLWISKRAFIAYTILIVLSITQFAGHSVNDIFEREGSEKLEDNVISSHNRNTDSIEIHRTDLFNNKENSTIAEEKRSNLPVIENGDVKTPQLVETSSGNISELNDNSIKYNKKPSVIVKPSRGIQNSFAKPIYSSELIVVPEERTVLADSLARLNEKSIHFRKEISFNDIPDIEIFPEIVDIPVSTSEEKEVFIKEKSIVKNRFVLSALVNTDLSTVRFDDFSNPGVGLGFKLSYKLTNRISLGAGITKTKRIYNVNSQQDYSLPQWLLDRQGIPDGVAAKCNITEIPISLRYDLIRSANSNLYGQISSSTFLMDREFYDFDFSASQGSPNLIQEWTVENQNRHFFGVVGVTFGYEKYFTKHLGIGLEFYWQTTIQGIGIYQINLNSVGNQILINYRL